MVLSGGTFSSDFKILRTFLTYDFTVTYVIVSTVPRQTSLLKQSFRILWKPFSDMFFCTDSINQSGVSEWHHGRHRNKWPLIKHFSIFTEFEASASEYLDNLKGVWFIVTLFIGSKNIDSRFYDFLSVCFVTGNVTKCDWKVLCIYPCVDSIVETFLQDIQVILKLSLQNYLNILKKWLLFTNNSIVDHERHKTYFIINFNIDLGLYEFNTSYLFK